MVPRDMKRIHFLYNSLGILAAVMYLILLLSTRTCSSAMVSTAVLYLHSRWSWPGGSSASAAAMGKSDQTHGRTAASMTYSLAKPQDYIMVILRGIWSNWNIYNHY